MDYLSGLTLEWLPIFSLGRDDGVLDVFKHSLSYKDGLPPYSQARIIDLISNRLLKARPHPCLWISVDAPGSWYFSEIKRLVKHKLPMTILPASHTSVDDTNFYPCTRSSNLRSWEVSDMGHCFDMEKYGIKESALRILRILARLKTAHTREVTSLAGLSETYVRSLLKQLQKRNLIKWKRIGKYDGWEIKNQGLRLAHRSWNIPIGAHFGQYRGEFRYAGERHRRVARMWRAWLESAYEQVEIWESWTEVPVHEGIPDALAWGAHYGYEKLFWLEVDSGHSSRKTMEKIYSRRLNLAHRHAREWNLPIVFCIMGPQWVVKHFERYDYSKFPKIAVIGHNWRDFGELPLYEMGDWHHDLMSSRILRFSRVGTELPFDPKRYPSKRKKEKTIKYPKPKSIKPRFSSQSEDADRWYQSRSEGEK